MSALLQMIHEEHAASAMVLQTIPLVLAHRKAGTNLPDFKILRDILAYLGDLSEKQHHKRESELLFPLVSERIPSLRPVLGHLEREHLTADLEVQHLEQALAAFETRGEAARADFEEAVERYMDFYLAHINLEECAVLPVAEQHFSDADWDTLDAAALRQREACDPEGTAARRRYQELLGSITASMSGTSVPAPQPA